jgi:CheY-like chemotaxis protein
MATVLLVEDDDDVREMIGRALQLGGHEVRAARHGREALALLHERHKPSLILTDLMMPVMDGWEFKDARARGHGRAAKTDRSRRTVDPGLPALRGMLAARRGGPDVADDEQYFAGLDQAELFAGH